jgi:transposase
MVKFIRQCCGIDVSKDSLDVALSALDESFNIKVLSTSQFENSKTGVRSIISWIKKYQIKDLPIQFVLEATGVYHDMATYTLYDKGFDVAIVLPNKISNYCRSTDVRTITDKISAKQICEFGLMKKLDSWKKPDVSLRMIKTLCRERIQLLNERTRVTNQKHAKDHSEIATQKSKKRAKIHIKFLNEQIKDIEKEIRAIVTEDQELQTKVKNICSVYGLGFITVITVIAETDGFNLIRNSRQLVCYAGYDAVHKTSGTSVKSKGRMSHKGNKHIRRALYFPAITAAKDGGYFTNLYERLYARQQVKMKSYVAIQRKLLVMIYTLWKNDEKYDLAKHKSIKYLEQPQRTALTELDLVRS